VDGPMAIHPPTMYLYAANGQAITKGPDSLQRIGPRT
jgi:hypothetical protein